MEIRYGDRVLVFPANDGCDAESLTEHDRICRAPVRFDFAEGEYSDWSGNQRLCVIHAWAAVSRRYWSYMALGEDAEGDEREWWEQEREAADRERWKFWPAIAQAWEPSPEVGA